MNNEEFKKEMMDTIANVNEYREEYQCNPLFHELIDGINKSDNVVESIVNTLYSYNQTLSGIVSVIANDTDENTVNKFMEHFNDEVGDDNE